MGQSFLVKLCLVALFTISCYASTECKRDAVSSKLKTVQEILTNQSKEIQKVLAGERSSSLDLLTIFGSGFKLDDTKEFIKKLEKQENLNAGIPIEYESLLKCLTELKQTKEIESFKLITKQLNQDKIELLRKNLELGNSIKEDFESRKAIPNLKSEIEEEKQESRRLKKETESSALEADKAAMLELSPARKDLVSYKSILAKAKIEIINKSLEYTEALEQNLKNFEEKSKELSQTSSKIGRENNIHIISDFEKVEETWKTVVDSNFAQIFNTDLIIELPFIPKLPTKPTETQEEALYQEIIQQHKELEALKLKTIKEVTEKKNKELKLQNTLLIQVNGLRSRIYNELPGHFILNKSLTGDYWISLKREIQASPYRILSFFYEKYLYFREKISTGKPGYKQLSLDLFYFIFCLALIYLVHYILTISIKEFNKRILQLTRVYREFKILQIISTYWNKIKDDSLYFVWLILIEIMKGEVYFEKYLLIIQIVEVLVLYKVLISIVTLFLGNISKVDFRNFKSFKQKADLTSKSIGKIFLIYALLMIVIQGAIGKVYVYSLINIIAVIYTFYRLTKESSQWNDEFYHYLEKNFSGIIISSLEKIAKFIPQKLKSIYYLTAILILGTFNIFIKLTENFEISKKISANLFKKQIESLETDEDASDSIPQSYKDHFALSSLEVENEYVCPSEGLEENLLNEITDWIESKTDEHSLVLYGDKGVGKTTLMKHIAGQIQNKYQDTLKYVYTKMPSKTLTEIQLNTFLCQTLGIVPVQAERFDLLQFDKALKSKMIIYIDEAQNAFLSQVGGFDAYYALINIINLTTENIYWMMSFNKYSWLYLDRAFGRSQFFRNVYELKGWSDTKIKELIMKRHSQSHFSLSYDMLISATKSEEEIDRYTSIESKFFKLLWELSSGNPRASLYLWLSALSRKSNKVFNVNIPKLVEIDDIHSSSDDVLFVIADVLKHENMTTKEIESTTNLPYGIIRNSIKVALEREYFFKDERDRYMIEITTQNNIIRYLRAKNFIYGN